MSEPSAWWCCGRSERSKHAGKEMEFEHSNRHKDAQPKAEKQAHVLTEPMDEGRREPGPVHLERALSHCCLYDEGRCCLDDEGLRGCMEQGHLGHDLLTAMSHEARTRREASLRTALELAVKGVPSAATVVIVICIAALVVVVVLGIYRIHLTHQQEGKSSDTAKERELDWDDWALTITVNPMENFKEPQASEEEASEEEEEEDKEEDEDDITSAESDDSEEEEEEEARVPRVQQGSKRGGQLDWANSTLSY